MRGTKAIVLIAGLLSASRLWLASLQTSNFYGSSLLGLSPDENAGVVNSISNSTDGVGWTQSKQGRRKIPLNILTDEQGQNVSCPPNTKPIFNNPLPSTNFSSDYKIPFVIHQTFKTRCATDDFYQLTLAWKALGVSYYFHDDAAIDRLVSSWYEEFPQLTLVWNHCITKPVVKTDLWRLLLLYEYGGIYADLDTKPESFQPNTTLRPEDEMYTVPDLLGLPAFHFMASMPRHPLTFITLQRALNDLLFNPDTGNYNPAEKTGPFAVKKAMRAFIRGHDPRRKQFAQIRGDEFTFHGMGGHTLRRDGSRATSNSIVKEFAVDNKVDRLQSNNVTHYSKTEVASGESCFDVLTRNYPDEFFPVLTLCQELPCD